MGSKKSALLIKKQFSRKVILTYVACLPVVWSLLLLVCSFVSLAVAWDAILGLLVATVVMVLGMLFSFCFVGLVLPDCSSSSSHATFMQECSDERRRRRRTAMASGQPTIGQMGAASRHY